MTTLDGKERGQAVARIRELFAIPDEIGSQTDPSPEVNKRSYAQEAALVKRDAEVTKLARQVIESRDEGHAELLLHLVRENVGRPVASQLAMVLAGIRANSVSLPKLAAAAPPKALRGLAELFEKHRPTDVWLDGPIYLDTLFSSLPNFWRAGLVALLLSDAEHAAQRLRPFFAPEAMERLGTTRRFEALLNCLKFLDPPREVAAMVVEALLELYRRSKVNRNQSQNFFDYLVAYFVKPGREADLAHLIELDCLPALLTMLFRGMTTGSPRNVKRIYLAVAAVAERVRGDSTALKRLELVDQAMGLKGQLLAGSSGEKKKSQQLPKEPRRVKVMGTVGTDGGPILAIPGEAAKQWSGVLRRDGSVPSDGNFAGTDYQRACDVSGGVGLIKVGRYRALALGNQGCDIVLRKEGGCVLVLAGDEADVSATLSATSKPAPKWRKLKGRLSLAGELLLFDAAMEQAKTKEKKRVPLKRGSYTVEQLGDENHSPWMVRLIPA